MSDTPKLFEDAEIDMLKSLTRFGVDGSLADDEIEFLANPETQMAAPIGLVRRARRMLAAAKMKSAMAGDGNEPVNLSKLRGLVLQCALHEELVVYEETLLNMTTNFYMLFNALRIKGIISEDDLVKAAATDPADLDRIEKIIAKIAKEETKDVGEQEEAPSTPETEGEGNDQTTH
jgi:CBS domain-containing protein